MRLFLFMSVPFVLFLSLLLLFAADGSTPTAYAQAVDGATARQLFLPIIRKPAPTPTPTPGPIPSPLKAKSGIHLGNRSSDWPTELFNHLRCTSAGAWPAAVVVLSNQLYEIIRYTRTSPTSECRIAGVLIKAPVAFAYLTAAVHAGTKVVIRIMPAPGNFTDYEQPGDAHVLSTSTVPAGADYCDRDEQGRWDFEKFRDYSDIAREMKSIFDVNTQHGWPAESFFFEPANEPNLEWYAMYGDVKPNEKEKQAWIDMDDYFAAIYDNVKATEPTLQILSAPMAQDNYAEHYAIGSCIPRWIDSENKKSGLDFMKQIYGYDFATQQESAPKADGYSWHNYWSQGQESWVLIGDPVPAMDRFCIGRVPEDPAPSAHVSQYHSAEIIRRIAHYATPTFITEADRKSPCQNGHEGSAEGELSKSAKAAEIRDSLVQFVEEERFARYIVAWLLVNEFSDGAVTCKSPDENGNLQPNHNYEQNWHEVYGEDGEVQPWFTSWWPVAQ